MHEWRFVEPAAYNARMTTRTLSSHRRRAGRSRSLLILLTLTSLAVAGRASAELRPLVREMLENLASLNEIGEAVALEDFERVKRAAADLQARAVTMQKIDVATLGVDPGHGPAFNGFLMAQQQASKAVAAAADGNDGAAVLLAVERLTTSACLGCHTTFRDRENLMRTSVLFMTTFLHSWQDINRGVMTNDFELVARRAYEIQTVARVLSWGQVIEATFGVSDADEQGEFRDFLRRMTAQASRVEKAATDGRLPDIAEATRRMWTDGCLGCHERFRSAN